MGKVKIFKDKRGEWRFNFVANNGKIVAISEGYKQKASIKIALNSIKDICYDEDVEIEGELTYDFW